MKLGAHLECACGKDDVVLTAGEAAARIGVHRAESAQRNELANAALAVQASDMGSEVSAWLVRGGPVERGCREELAAIIEERVLVRVASGLVVPALGCVTVAVTQEAGSP